MRNYEKYKTFTRRTAFNSYLGMILIQDRIELEAYLAKLNKGVKIGFVPTMGALHEGHLSLLRAASEQDDVIICSIFVNPTQFNDKSDYDKYPQVLAEDLQLLSQVSVDVVFAPAVDQIYPTGIDTIPYYDIGDLETRYEGEHRPGHFQGVCHILHVFLNMIKPHHLYMGEKDYQQVAVVRKLIELKHHSATLVSCPTLREASGLAMSSRNRLLSPNGLENASAMYRALQYVKHNAGGTEFTTLKKEAYELLKVNGFEPEYLDLCEATNMTPLNDFNHEIPMRLVAAAFIEGVRLIDNIGIG